MADKGSGPESDQAGVQTKSAADAPAREMAARRTKAEQRKDRLAAQLRENLKKRKDLSRARKTSDRGGNSSANPS